MKREGEKFDRQTELNIYNKQNPWISLLRIFMCFVVVRDHFLPTGDTIAQKIVGEFGSIAVPCFMFISFYFMGEDIKTLNINKIKNRILRLYVPILVWNIIYYGSKNIIFFIFGKSEYVIGVNGLIEGLLFTHYPGLPGQLWFLFSQIIILIFICISLSYSNSSKCKNIILVVITILAFIIEYTGVNSELFESSDYAVKYPFGRVVECIPYAMFGILYFWNLKEKKTSIKLYALATCLLLAIVSGLYVSQPAGFGYGGLYLLFASTSICIFAFILPDKINGRLRIVINYIGSCTMGVYCLHMLIGWMVQLACSQNALIERIMHTGTLIFDALIFVICLVITFLIRLINRKLNWKWIKYSV